MKNDKYCDEWLLHLQKKLSRDLLAFSKTLVGKGVQRKLYVVTLHDWILLEKMHSFM